MPESPAYPQAEPPPYPPPESPTYAQAEPTYQEGYPQPSYPPPAYGAPPYQQPYPAVAARPTNSLAIAALVCSLAGLIIGISAPVGAVLGHMAMRQIAQTGEEGAGLAKAAIIVGWVITGLIVLSCCVIAIVIIAAANSGT
jgi:Domain of unknown function (DUF4190)